jgi:hypothetical protein
VQGGYTVEELEEQRCDVVRCDSDSCKESNREEIDSYAALGQSRELSASKQSTLIKAEGWPISSLKQLGSSNTPPYFGRADPLP